MHAYLSSQTSTNYQKAFDYMCPKESGQRCITTRVVPIVTTTLVAGYVAYKIGHLVHCGIFSSCVDLQGDKIFDFVTGSWVIVTTSAVGLLMKTGIRECKKGKTLKKIESCRRLEEGTQFINQQK